MESRCPLCGQALASPENTVPKPICGAVILASVAAEFGLTAETLLAKDRHKTVVFARHVACFLMRRHTGRSYPEIGRAMGNRDHTTIMHSERAIEAWIWSRPAESRELFSRLSSRVGVPLLVPEGNGQ